LQGVELLFLISVTVAIIHSLWFCHELVGNVPGLHQFVYPFLVKLNAKHGLLNHPLTTKAIVLLLLGLYALGSKGRIDPTITRNNVLSTAAVGLGLFIGPILLLYGKSLISPILIDVVYVLLTGIGMAYLIKAGQYFSRLFFGKGPTDIFNEVNEEFPQNQAFAQNEYSIHFKTTYHYRGQWREGIINILNPFRSNMVLGVPGSGKSFAILIPALWQSIFKGYTAYVYDFKFPDLTEEAYNAYQKTILENPYAWTPKEQLTDRKRAKKPLIPRFYVINFDDIAYSHRCNPLLPDLMTDVMDAYEAAQTIMLNLNRTWAQKQGEFFPESAINFLTSVLWYLRTVSLKYRTYHQRELAKPVSEQNPDLLQAYDRLSNVCTFPHTLEFVNRRYDETFAVMEQYPEVEVYVRPFIDARAGGAMEQLEGQISSVRIPMARLSSPTLYWVMTGNDFSLDINNPDDPKILCTGNNPKRVGIYGTAFSLYTARMIKLINEKNKLKSALFWDELPTMFIKGIDLLIATARSNKVATWLGIQDFEQLARDYGEKEAKVITNIIGNFFSGTVVFETAEKLARRFGKTNQEKESITYSKNDTTVNVSTQQADVIPASKISTLKQGEFVGQFADNFGEECDLKTFKAYIAVEQEQLKKTHKLPVMNDIGQLVEALYGQPYHQLGAEEQLGWKNQLLQDNYRRIKNDIKLLIDVECAEFGIEVKEKKGAVV
jgi:hypothetical protein